MDCLIGCKGTRPWSTRHFKLRNVPIELAFYLTTMVKRAFLMGVPHTDYRPGVRFMDLPTVLDDVSSMYTILTARGFADANVLSQHSGVTAVQASSAMLDLVKRTGDGDLSVIYFAGHGWTFPDSLRTPDEPYDECLIFSDTALVDDWAKSELWPSARPGARFVVIIDACHSETALLDLVEPEPPPPPTRGTASVPPWWRLTLAACGDQETTLGLADAGDRGGASTIALAHTLQRQADITHRELWPEVARYVLKRFGPYGAGGPVQRYAGPDDSLLEARAFEGKVETGRFD